MFNALELNAVQAGNVTEIISYIADRV